MSGNALRWPASSAPSRRRCQVARLAGVEIVAPLGSDLVGEARRAGANEDFVRQALEHGAGNRDRVSKADQSADRAGAQRRAVHDGGIEFDLTKDIRPGIIADAADVRIGFDEANAGFRRVEGGFPGDEGVGRCRDADAAFVIGDDDHLSASSCRRNAGCGCPSDG